MDDESKVCGGKVNKIGVSSQFKDYCKHPIREGKSFCSYCGTKLGNTGPLVDIREDDVDKMKEDVVCPKRGCGATIVAGDRFCADCGTSRFTKPSVVSFLLPRRREKGVPKKSKITR